MQTQSRAKRRGERIDIPGQERVCKIKYVHGRVGKVIVRSGQYIKWVGRAGEGYRSERKEYGCGGYGDKKKDTHACMMITKIWFSCLPTVRTSVLHSSFDIIQMNMGMLINCRVGYILNRTQFAILMYLKENTYFSLISSGGSGVFFPLKKLKFYRKGKEPGGGKVSDFFYA